MWVKLSLVYGREGGGGYYTELHHTQKKAKV